MILDPDFTMQDECCKVDNDVRVIIKTNQKVTFDTPIYTDTLHVIQLGGIHIPLVKDIDWKITEADIDYSTMSKLRLSEPDFLHQVINSITIIKPIVADIKVNFKYQQVFPIRSKLVLLHGKPLEFTPADLYELMQKVSYLVQLTKPVTSVEGEPLETSPRMLELDRHKERPENLVLGEEHTVNVPNDQLFVKPICGSFFKDSLVVKFVDGFSSSYPLIENTDYVVVGVDYVKTRQTNNTSGIYNFIMLLKPYVGKVSIDYHAFGGDPSLYDFVEMESAVNNITTYLRQSEFLTQESIATTDVIQNIIHSLIHLEDDMRRLIKEGRPSYGDVTSGKTLLRRIVSLDTNLHWWDIASLYTVDSTAGSSEPITADTFKFRITTTMMKLMFECSVAVNLNNGSNVMEVRCINDCYPKGYVPFEDYSEIEFIPRPQLRIIYNKNTEQNSGVLLQLGLELKKNLEETILVEDLSGQQSCWKLLEEVTGDTGEPRDDMVQLPNITHIWDSTNIDSKVERILVPFKDGHLIWAGNESLNRPIQGYISKDLVHFLNNNVDLKTIAGISLEMEELGGSVFSQRLEFVKGSDNLTANTSFYYNGMSAYVNVKLWRDVITQNINLNIGSDIGVGLSGNQLDLRHVFIYT